MSKNITLLGASYSDVPAVRLPVTGGGTADFTDVSDTTATAADVAQGKYFYLSDGSRAEGTSSGGGGADRLKLLATQSLGTISTASTSSENTGQSVIVSGVGSYDLLIVETSVDTIVNSRHAATIAYIPLMNSSNIATKSSGLIATAKTNIKVSSSGIASSRAGTTAYGIYPNSISLSSGTATMPMYQRYNSSTTGTINGAYTVRVYGVNLYDLIGG